MSEYSKKAEEVAEKQRKIQDFIDKKDKEAAAQKEKHDQQQAAQAGERKEPEPPFPGQKLEKPGLEADMNLQPKYKAPDYKGSGKLDGKVAIITGGDSGIGRAVAVLFAREGADVAIVYLTEHEDAEQTKKDVEAEGRRAITISGDVAQSDFCQAAVEQTVQEFGKVNILVNNAAFQAHAEDMSWITDDQFDMTMKTNLYGYFYMAGQIIGVLGGVSN